MTNAVSNLKELLESHVRGSLSIEKDLTSEMDCDFGIQISIDGRVWICIDGVAFIRFKPTQNQKLLLDNIVEYTIIE